MKRKNNFIINTEDNPTKEQKRELIDKNTILYEISKEKIREIRLPRWSKSEAFLTLEEIETNKLTTLEKLMHLEALRKEIEKKLDKQ